MEGEMENQSLSDFLNETLDDSRLSRGERRILHELLEEGHPSRRDQELILHEAFSLARHRIPDARDKRILEWLEDVVKTLRPASDDIHESHHPQALFFPSDHALDRLVEILDNTRRTMDICVFTVTHDRLSRAVELAHRRGVKVRLLTDDDKAMDRGSDVIDLNQAGIPVRTDHSSAHMHHKFALLDNRTLVTGSFNWTRSAERENQENLLLTDDPFVISQYAEEFDRLWAMFSPGSGA
jgi:mitochondrial cardiolipin hydrolase